MMKGTTDQTKSANEMSRAELLAATPRQNWNEEVVCRSLVLVPTGRTHDSGFGAMEFVALDADLQPICRMSGCSDVVQIDGIGGYGEWNASGGLPDAVPPHGWSIDCLRKSRLLRIFCNGPIKCGPSLSSFEVYCQPKGVGR